MSLRGFFLHLYCGLLINYGHVLIFISLSSFVISIKISILNSWLILEHSISYEQISFLLSVSFHIFQTSIFHFLFSHFLSSNSPLGHYISCLMIYLGSVSLISFILYQELYLLFDLIKFNDLLFFLYLISISITRGQ